METELLRKLADKSMTKEQLLHKVKRDPDLFPEVLEGVFSSNPGIRYGCAKVLMDLSEEHPKKLYPYMDSFINLLDSKHRILVWNAIAILANLTKVDTDNRFDAIFDKYFSFLNDEYMVTVANVVGHSGKIALAKPYLVNKIAHELLKVENISTTIHLTEECKKVIAEKTIKSFSMFFDKTDQKEKIISFVERHRDSPRKTLRKEAEAFLTKFRWRTLAQHNRYTRVNYQFSLTRGYSSISSMSKRALKVLNGDAGEEAAKYQAKTLVD